MDLLLSETGSEISGVKSVENFEKDEENLVWGVGGEKPYGMCHLPG